MIKMSRLETGMIEIHQEKASLYETLGQAAVCIVPAAEKKRIRLYVECEESSQAFHDKKWTQEAVFNVLDNGKGIAKERQAQIFKRFYRKPEVRGVDGIGVGLYLTRKILTMQKGYMEVRSEEGKGADFRMYLPNESLDKI